MALNATIDVIEKPPVPVKDEVAELLTSVHAALIGLPGDRAANVDFPNDDFPGENGVKEFLAQAKAWADKQGDKRFTRVGDIKGQPNRVSFRVVTKRAPAEDPTPSAEGASAPAEPASA